ncbi:MAG TPA: MBL fold metallo-hydrolase, partial [Myxococcota bacterium]|nr:MBL fold metallo-hydrolase [Myxococcota bacterium]
MRRAFAVVGILIAALAAIVGAYAWVAFGHLAPNEAAELDGVGFTLLDGYVSIGVVPLPAGGVLLVDAGVDPEGVALRDGLAARGLSLADVRAVLVTHGHPDHVAALRLMPGAEVVAMAEERPFIEGERAFAGPLPSLFPAEAHGAVTRPARDGERVEIGGRVVEGLLIPGHTPGSAAWLIDGVLFVGDAASADDQGRLVTAPWVFSDDLALDAASLRALGDRLAARPIAAVVTSHTGV